jgi:hypothetical protein
MLFKGYISIKPPPSKKMPSSAIKRLNGIETESSMNWTPSRKQLTSDYRPHVLVEKVADTKLLIAR